MTSLREEYEKACKQIEIEQLEKNCTLMSKVYTDTWNAMTKENFTGNLPRGRVKVTLLEDKITADYVVVCNIEQFGSQTNMTDYLRKFIKMVFSDHFSRERNTIKEPWTSQVPLFYEKQLI